MIWVIHFYAGTEEAILAMPPKLQARTIRLLELMEQHGANLGTPHTEAMGDGLFELRAKAPEGIARALYCYQKGKNIVILHAFVKKSQKTPRKELALARVRMREVLGHESSSQTKNTRITKH
ncbi:MAG: type II toxin-antitoxin system RelE/ParE family toxin [Thiohalomonadaceae bacterium]